MKQKVKTENTIAGRGGRAAILAAVSKLLVDQGPGSVSVDNILLASGLSKGGFFYHFKTKQEALLAAFESQVEQVSQLVLSNVRSSDPLKGRVLQAYIRTLLEPAPEMQQQLLKATVRTLIALMNEDPKLMPGLARVFRASEKLIAEDGIDWPTRVMICETVEGIWISRALGIGQYSETECRRITEHLSDLIVQSTSPSREDDSRFKAKAGSKVKSNKIRR